MKDKTFRRVMFALLAVGVIATAVLMYFTINSYMNCSIIKFIGGELW